jgi:hypothetical protein
MRILKDGFKRIQSYNGFTEYKSLVKKDVDKTEGIFARHFGFKPSREIQIGDFIYIEYIWQKQ